MQQASGGVLCEGGIDYQVWAVKEWLKLVWGKGFRKVLVPDLQFVLGYL